MLTKQHMTKNLRNNLEYTYLVYIRKNLVIIVQILTQVD